MYCKIIKLYPCIYKECITCYCWEKCELNFMYVHEILKIQVSGKKEVAYWSNWKCITWHGITRLRLVSYIKNLWHMFAEKMWQKCISNRRINRGQPIYLFFWADWKNTFQKFKIQSSDLLFTVYTKIFYFTERYRLVFRWTFIWWLITLKKDKSISEKFIRGT